MPKKVKKLLVMMPLARLQPHPQQSMFFSDLGDLELQALADDLAANGLTHPVEVSGDGTIICGHQRVRAAKLLGWSKIKCWVRQDLADKGPAAVEKRLLDDNFNRRQLDALGIARIASRLIELKGGSRNGNVYDELGERFRLSPRQLRRLVHMLDAPVVIQSLYSQGALTAELVRRVADLSNADQQQIVQRIADGERPKQVVREFVERDAEDPGVQDQHLRRVVLYLDKNLSTLDIGKADLKSDFWSGFLDTLDEVVAFFDELRRKVRKRRT